MPTRGSVKACRQVALRKESVDRNSTGSASIRAYIVALRKESVDRNKGPLMLRLKELVALRKESVDRNSAEKYSMSYSATSLSARRAWIEMVAATISRKRNGVALRKESVDRNWSLSP